MKVWEISCGKNVFEFSVDMGKDVGIRAMDVDIAGKRCVAHCSWDVQNSLLLPRIVTGGDNGEIKLWNYSNGHCIRILDKGMLVRELNTVALASIIRKLIGDIRHQVHHSE